MDRLPHDLLPLIEDLTQVGYEINGSTWVTACIERYTHQSQSEKQAGRFKGIGLDSSSVVYTVLIKAGGIATGTTGNTSSRQQSDLKFRLEQSLKNRMREIKDAMEEAIKAHIGTSLRIEDDGDGAPNDVYDGEDVPDTWCKKNEGVVIDDALRLVPSHRSTLRRPTEVGLLDEDHLRDSISNSISVQSQI